MNFTISRYFIKIQVNKNIMTEIITSYSDIKNRTEECGDESVNFLSLEVLLNRMNKINSYYGTHKINSYNKMMIDDVDEKCPDNKISTILKNYKLIYNFDSKLKTKYDFFDCMNIWNDILYIMFEKYSIDYINNLPDDEFRTFYTYYKTHAETLDTLITHLLNNKLIKFDGIDYNIFLNLYRKKLNNKEKCFYELDNNDIVDEIKHDIFNLTNIRIPKICIDKKANIENVKLIVNNLLIKIRKNINILEYNCYISEFDIFLQIDEFLETYDCYEIDNCIVCVSSFLKIYFLYENIIFYFDLTYSRWNIISNDTIVSDNHIYKFYDDMTELYHCDKSYRCAKTLINYTLEKIIIFTDKKIIH